jgi:hypothetical protein
MATTARHKWMAQVIQDVFGIAEYESFVSELFFP